MKKNLLVFSLISIVCIQNQLKADSSPTQSEINSFVKAAGKGNYSSVNNLSSVYKNDPKLIDGAYKGVLQPLQNSTALVNAAKEGDMDMVEILIKKGANSNVVSNGYSLLNWLDAWIEQFRSQGKSSKDISDYIQIKKFLEQHGATRLKSKK